MHAMWAADSFLDRAQEFEKKTIDEHAEYNTAELDRSQLVKKGAATRRQLGEQVGVNTHTMGTSFVGKVRGVRQIAQAQIGEGVAEMVEFNAQVNGHEATEKASRIQVWQGLSDWQLADRFDKDRLSFFHRAFGGVCSTSQSSRVQGQKPTRRARCKQCAQCKAVKEFGKNLHKMQLVRGGKC